MGREPETRVFRRKVGRPSRAFSYFAVQQQMGRAIAMAKTTVAAWHDGPTWYMVSAEDQTIDADLERFMAKRRHAKAREVEASHIALISHPGEVADLILDAVAEQQ